MAAYVMVVDSPYFAVSDRDGAFHIPSVPPGTYRYHAWRPGGDDPERHVVVRAGHAAARSRGHEAPARGAALLACALLPAARRRRRNHADAEVDVTVGRLD